jgi:integrase
MLEECNKQTVPMAGIPSCLRAEDINWDTRTIFFTGKKLRSRGTNVKPALFRFSAEVEVILKQLPVAGQLFPYLCAVRACDRATEFKQRCAGLGITGVTLHSYRCAWAERALKCGFPERFAKQALGHNSKAVPSLDDWEKDWRDNPQRSVQTKLLAGDSRVPLAAPAIHPSALHNPN